MFKGLLCIITLQLIFPLTKLLTQSADLLFASINLLESEKLAHCSKNPFIVCLAAYVWIFNVKAKFDEFLVVIVYFNQILEFFFYFCDFSDSLINKGLAHNRFSFPELLSRCDWLCVLLVILLRSKYGK